MAFKPGKLHFQAAVGKPDISKELVHVYSNKTLICRDFFFTSILDKRFRIQISIPLLTKIGQRAIFNFYSDHHIVSYFRPENTKSAFCITVWNNFYFTIKAIYKYKISLRILTSIFVYNCSSILSSPRLFLPIAKWLTLFCQNRKPILILITWPTECWSTPK